MMLRMADKNLRTFMRDRAHGRVGACSERRAGGLVWFPMINGERIPTNDAPYETIARAKNEARDFKQRCRDELE